MASEETVAVSANAPIPVSLIGRRARLRPAMKEDIPYFYAWRSNLLTLHLWTPNRRVVSFQEFVSEFDRWTRDSMLIVVTTLASDEPQGFLRAYNMNFSEGWVWIQGTPGPDRLSMRQATQWAEAFYLFTKYLFDCFPLRKLYSEVYEFNDLMVRLHKKVGFGEEGRLRDHSWYGQKYWDTLLFGLTREEWLGAVEKFSFILAVEQDAAEVMEPQEPSRFDERNST